MIRLAVLTPLSLGGVFSAVDGAPADHTVFAAVIAMATAVIVALITAFGPAIRDALRRSPPAAAGEQTRLEAYLAAELERTRAELAAAREKESQS